MIHQSRHTRHRAPVKALWRGLDVVSLGSVFGRQVDSAAGGRNSGLLIAVDVEELGCVVVPVAHYIVQLVARPDDCMVISSKSLT